jgi:hypothetical protein
VSVSNSLRLILRLAVAAALVAVAEAGPTFMPGSAAGENPSGRALLGSPAFTRPGAPASGPVGASPTPRLQNLSRIPLSFEANQGQTDAQVQYLARGPGYSLFLTATEAVLALRRWGRSLTCRRPARQVGNLVGNLPHNPRPPSCACSYSAATQRRRPAAPIECRVSPTTSWATMPRNGERTSLYSL